MVELLQLDILLLLKAVANLFSLKKYSKLVVRAPSHLPTRSQLRKEKKNTTQVAYAYSHTYYKSFPQREVNCILNQYSPTNWILSILTIVQDLFNIQKLFSSFIYRLDCSREAPLGHNKWVETKSIFMWENLTGTFQTRIILPCRKIVVWNNERP